MARGIALPVHKNARTGCRCVRQTNALLCAGTGGRSMGVRGPAKVRVGERRLRSRVRVGDRVQFSRGVSYRCVGARGQARIGRAGRVLGTLCLVQVLSGCFVDTEKPELKLDVPDRYRLAHGNPEVAPPTLDWWRGFR